MMLSRGLTVDLSALCSASLRGKNSVIKITAMDDTQILVLFCLYIKSKQTSKQKTKKKQTNKTFF